MPRDLIKAAQTMTSRLVTTAFFVLFSVLLFSQNLVPNGSFEDTVSCPDNPGQVSRSVGWTNYSGSVDYYNSCASAGFVSTPENIYGYQNPADGNAYIGIVTYALDDTNA